MTRWKVIVTVICVVMGTLISTAQTTPRDYVVSNPTVIFGDDGATFMIEFTVTNNGGDAGAESDIQIIYNTSGLVLARDTLPPLNANEVVTVTFAFNSSDFTAGSVEPFRVEVGVDQYELAGSPIARDNIRTFSVTIPQGITNLPEDVTPPALDEPPDFVIPGLDIGVQILDDGIIFNDEFYSLSQILTGVGIIGFGLLLLWFVTIILRLLFRRPPKFGTWQPPYANVSYYDPNSSMGRRQAWQHHAQNGTIFAPCTQSAVVALKRLLDMEGKTLGGWEIKAIRTVQYDMYGRVTRTEAIMPSSVLKKLNKVARKASDYDNPKLRKAVQPIAREIAKQASKNISKKSTMLPIAMDLRFEGKHGEVRILFELYECRNHAWHLLDQWEPEMAIIGHKIDESYTYTLNGQLPGETYKDYRNRLVEDFGWLLGGMLYRHQAPAQPEPDMVPPDTLTGMAPITDESLPAVDA